MTPTFRDRSFIIPVLDFSPHGPYNIRTLLEDLEGVEGEVICIFNSLETFEAMRHHQRVNKYCFNSQNAGVSRSWNLGLNLAEGKTVFILNADLHMGPSGIGLLEDFLHASDDAVIAGPQGSHIDFPKLSVVRYFQRGQFHEPVRTHDVSGFYFAVHMERFRSAKLSFDVQFSPCFFEEWDMGLQALQAGLSCHAVPVLDFDHRWGVSNALPDHEISYFGKNMKRDEIMRDNTLKFVRKWGHLIPFS